MKTKIDRAIESGLAFLAQAQSETGEIAIFTSLRRDMTGELLPDPSVFPTALAGYALGFVPGAQPLVERAIQYLLGQRSARGVWHHWRRDHPRFDALPPDTDDTSCASIVLKVNNVAGATDRRILLDNRNANGLFYTWFLPRLRWTCAPLRRIMLDQWRAIRRQGPYFADMSAANDDVDAVVNANCLYAIGPFKGDHRVVEHLIGILRAGDETMCDKWYDDPFVVWYFFSRVLPSRAPEAADLIVQRIGTAAPQSAQDFAFGLASLIACGRPPPQDWIARLLDAQLPNGAWPRSVIYTGGRPRGPDGRLGAPIHPFFWGSEALTSAFCLQALAQSRQALAA